MLQNSPVNFLIIQAKVLIAVTLFYINRQSPVKSPDIKTLK